MAAPPTVRRALIKLLVATAVLAGLSLLCFADINGGLKGVLAVAIVILAFPITLLLGIDASRVIKREVPNHKSLRLMGRFLAFPQAVMGIILVGFAVAYPLFGLREAMDLISIGRFPAFPLAFTLIAALSFGVGLHYIREGLGFKKGDK
jgi:hypothetical protein